MIYLIIASIYLASMLFYFRIAAHFNIVDRPNERSSHSELTIRGGGIIFLIAALTAGLLHTKFWVPVSALIIVGIISFIDDKFTLSSSLRLIFHLTGATLIFSYLGVFELFPIAVVLLLYVITIGIVNAYNFMDGINGITGGYSLVVLIGLQYVNTTSIHFIENDMIWLPILANLVFLVFNFRKKAKCFAGDVGSITMAFWIVFLLFSLIIDSGDYKYILFLAVYGIDTVLTIVHRLLLGQNIFAAHRLHCYQILANERRVPQLIVSSCYALIQTFIIIIIIKSTMSFLCLVLLIIIPLIMLYLIIKFKTLLYK